MTISKKKSALDRAIAALDVEIAGLELAKRKLIEVKGAAPPRQRRQAATSGDVLPAPTGPGRTKAVVS